MRRLFIEQEASEPDHKRREHKRLDALIGYCEASSCRRHTLLEYFGETPDRDAGCGNCDICLNPPEMTDGAEAARKLLSAAVRSGQMYGQAHLIDIVRGADTEKIRTTRHNELPTYGVGADLSKDEWRSIVRQLVAAGFLRLDVTGHGGLSLTAKGQALLTGEQGFSYRRDVINQRKSKAGRRGAGKSATAPAHDLSADQTALLARLKDKRTELARERNVPAYLIFSDRSLHDMARLAPGDKTAFGDIHGVGAAKLRDFADTFLGIIAGRP
jgi:ATP-dependent DNA helicase RecQ